MPIPIYYLPHRAKTAPQSDWRPVCGAFYLHTDGTLCMPDEPVQGARAVVLDDRNLPTGEIDAAPLLSVLSQAEKPLLISDFERPVQKAFEALLMQCAPYIGALAVPRQYAHVPHQLLLTQPYIPSKPFSDWSEESEPFLADLKPVCFTVSPGSLPEPIAFAAVQKLLRQYAPTVRYAQSLTCCYFSYSEHERPVFVLYDTPQTFSNRLQVLSQRGVSAGIVLQAEYDAMCKL